MINGENKPASTAPYKEWLQSEFNRWLSRCLEMSHEEIIHDAGRIYVDLYERGAAACSAEEYAEWAAENNIYEYEIESLQIDEDFCVHPAGIGRALKKAAAEREQRGVYIPIDSYKPRELRDSLKRKVADEYDGALAMFRCMDKKNLILHAYEVTQLEWFHGELDSQLSGLPLDRRLSAMIRLKDPLTAVGRKWWAAKKWDPVQDYSQFIDCIGILETELDENSLRYELDGRYHTPEPEAPAQEQGPEKQPHPPGPAQGVTMC